MAYPHRAHPLILVLGDHGENRESLLSLLQSMAFVVSTAGNFSEAIEEVTAQRPDLILTDNDMAGGDAYELISSLRSFGDQIPVVAISGDARRPMPEGLSIGEHASPNATVLKPFRASHLVETIDRTLAGRLAA